MSKAIFSRSLLSAVCGVALAASLTGAAVPQSHAAGLAPIPPSAPASSFTALGSHKVITNLNTVPAAKAPGGCGTTAQLLGFDGTQCSPMSNPLTGVVYWYPADLATMAEPAPLVVWTPGIVTDPSINAPVARLLASRGMVVVTSYDYLDFTPLMPQMAVKKMTELSKDAKSPFYNKVDFSRTVVGGYSAGGGVAGTLSSYPELLTKYNPEVKIIGAIAQQPGPNGISENVTIPTLVLTGSLDWVTDVLPRNLFYKPVTAAPAWIGQLKEATHWESFRATPLHGFAELEVAFIEYLANGNKDAAAYFVGPNWKMNSMPNYTKVERNAKAAALS